MVGALRRLRAGVVLMDEVLARGPRQRSGRRQGEGNSTPAAKLRTCAHSAKAFEGACLHSSLAVAPKHPKNYLQHPKELPRTPCNTRGTYHVLCCNCGSQVDVILHPLKSELNFPTGPKALLDGASPRAVRWNLPMHLLDVRRYARLAVGSCVLDGRAGEKRGVQEISFTVLLHNILVAKIVF